MLPWLPISHIAKSLHACAAFALFASFPALATVTISNDFSGTFTEVSSATPLSYAADVSASDLLHGITPTVTGWNSGNNAHPNELTDGIHGAAFQAVSGDAVQGAWTTVGATATYQLGTGANGRGYDITSVRSIADWANVGFGNQAWKMEVKPVGGSYVILATVDYQSLGSGTGTTKVTLSNLNASGIESIKITANSVNGGANSGAFVWRELDFFGSPTNDTTPPTISSLSPADGVTGVLPSTNLVATFNENIALGTGAIILRNLDTASEIAINLPDPQVSVSGKLLTINPTANLAAGTNYAVRIGAAAVEDMSGLTFAGLADDTTWNFTTGEPDVTPPAIVTLSPADGATNVTISNDLTVTFNENIALGTGTITIKNLGAASETLITLPDARVSVSGAVLRINPSGNFATLASHAVRISPGAITDISGNSFSGIEDDTTWNFTTSSALLVKVFLLGGQSNMVGQAPSSGLPISPVNLQQPQNDVLFYYAGSELTTLRPGSGGNPPPSGAHFGSEVTFGRAVADASPTVSYAIIKHGENGTALYNDWAPGTGSSYTAFRNTVAAGLAALQAAGYSTEIVGMLWHQGESDAIEGQQANYQTNLTAFIADIRSRYGSNLPFLIGEIRRSNGPAFVTVADAQIAVAAAVPRAAFVPASDLSFSDTYHFNASSLMTLGQRFAASYAILSDTTPPAVATLNPADNATNVPPANDLTVTFNENIALGTGTITIKNLSNASDTVITLPDARVSVSGAVLRINPSSNLTSLAHHAIRISPGAITDLSDNPFTGISDDTTWNFVTATTPLRIMCMGDSITTGYTDNPGWVNHPFEFGYRSGLYTLLTNAGYNFLFVGGSTEPWTGISGDPTRGGTYTPPLDLRTFGQDGHRGYGGQAASFLNSNIVAWLASDNPDIILLKIGTNNQDQTGLNTLVNTITTTKPDCHLIIAQIMPKYSYQAGIVTYNTYIRNTLVPNYQALGKKVSMVDQYAPFLTNPAVLTSIDQSLFSNGINHPDNDGYDKMALVWFDGIKALGIGPNSFTSWISNPTFGIAPGQQGLDQDPDGDGIENGIENFFGTNPGAFSQGLSSGPVNAAAGTFIFTHSINPTPASNLTATYRWSKNLTTFTDDGNAFEGTTVTFSRGAPTGGVVTVTASVTGILLDRLFVDVKVQEN